MIAMATKLGSISNQLENRDVAFGINLVALNYFCEKIVFDKAVGTL